MRTAHLLAFATLALPATAQTEEPSTAAQTSTEASTDAQVGGQSEGDEGLEMLGELQSGAEFMEQAHGIKFQREGVGQLGSRATVVIPKGFVFADAAGAKKFLEVTKNFESGDELGLIASESLNPWAVFEFQDMGYVEDKEKDDLDADALLAGFREGNEASKAERRSRGWPTFDITGWKLPPRYNPSTNNLEWAIELLGESGNRSINHDVRLLGRRGVVQATLVCDADTYAAVLPQFEALLDDFEYVSGERYSEYVSGDKVAALGLTALVAGGAGVIAAKTGLLSKLWKPIAIGLIAIGAFVKKIFGFGKKEESSS